MSLSDAQSGMMRNALGLLYAETPYRNRFALYWGGERCDDWVDLCRQGLAEHYHTDPGGMMFFGVTEAGFVALGLDPKLIENC